MQRKVRIKDIAEWREFRQARSTGYFITGEMYPESARIAVEKVRRK
jgi:hypothetical protein